MRSLGLSWVTWLFRQLRPCPEKRPDFGLTLELAAQFVVLPSNSPSCTTKEVAVVGAQPNGARLSSAALMSDSLPLCAASASAAC